MFYCLCILQVTQLDLHRHFHALGTGVIEDVRIQRDKGFGFVRYSSHNEAALAIQMGNTQSLLCGKLIKVCYSAHMEAKANQAIFARYVESQFNLSNFELYCSGFVLLVRYS